MADNPELGRRLRDAKRGWEQRHDYDLSWRELGERIGAAMGREAFAYQVVQRWFQLGREPGEFVDTLAAIARVLEADPRDLTFGEPPPPAGDAATDTRPRAVPPDAFLPSPTPAHDAGAGEGQTRRRGNDRRA